MTAASERPRSAWVSTAVLAAVLVSGLVCSTQPLGWGTLATYELPGAAMVGVILLAVRHYRPYYSINETAWWAHLPATPEPRPAAPPDSTIALTDPLDVGRGSNRTR